MKEVVIAGRCLTCWRFQWVTVQIDRHLPAGFKAGCPTCQVETMHAVTGQLVPTLTPAQMREIRHAHKGQRPVRWEQIPLVLDLTTTARVEQVENVLGARDASVSRPAGDA